MLRVLIEVEPSAGGVRKLVLRPGQQLDFGSSEYAHVALRDDAGLSATHFRLRADREACYLQDLGSSNGTFVNDELVDSVVLRDGDRITAGNSNFQVSIEGGEHREGGPSAPAVIASRPNRTARPDRTAAGGSPAPTFQAETCHSGLLACRGACGDVAPAALAAQLTGAFPLHLLVDFHKLKQRETEEGVQALADRGHCLIDWLGEEVAAAMSPRFLSAEDFDEWPRLVKAGWGADAVICVYSRQESGQLLTRLRRMVRGGEAETPGGIIGCCWPSVLEGLLRSSSPEAAGEMLSGIEAVLIESREDPQQWIVIGPAGVADALGRCGLEQNQDAPALPLEGDPGEA